MKQLISLLIMLLPFHSSSQSVATSDSASRNLISDLMATWTLGVDSNSNTVDITMFNKYKDLFIENARIDDDLHIRYIPGPASGSYRILPVTKDFDEYAHDVALEINNLRIDAVSAPERLNRQGQIVYEIKRTVYIEKPARYILTETDSLTEVLMQQHPDIIFEKRTENALAAYRQEIRSRLKAKLEEHPDSVYRFRNTSTMQVSLVPSPEAAGALKIESIRIVDNALRILNDQDLDAVPDFADINPSLPGSFTAKGAPDADLDGIADSADFCRYAYGIEGNQGCPDSYFRTGRQWDASLGLQSNLAKLALPALDELGYQDASGSDATDVLQSSAGSLKSPGASAGVYAAGNFTFFFGKNARKSGLSAGIQFTRFSTTYELQDPIIYTYKSNDGTDDYRRQISVSMLNEKISYSVFNIPVQFNYRTKMGVKKNWVVQFRAGPSLLYMQVVSDYNTTVDVGGIYQIDSASGDRITYYDYFNSGSSWNVYLTTTGINKQSTATSAAAVFDGLQRAGGYDFASGKVYRDQKSYTRLSYALNFSCDAQYKKSQESPLSFKIGLHLTYAPSIAGNEKYRMIDKTSDAYNSIFNSNGASYYFAYAASVGLLYDF